MIASAFLKSTIERNSRIDLNTKGKRRRASTFETPDMNFIIRDVLLICTHPRIVCVTHVCEINQSHMHESYTMCV